MIKFFREYIFLTISYSLVLNVSICWRILGGHFFLISSKFVTFQESNSGTYLQEATFKSFIGGEKIACRPNYGRETDYFSWEHCGKCWEMNICTPAIKGDSNDMPSWKSWTRRLIVCELESSFSSNKSKIDTENKIFEEDVSLKKFLNSDLCRLAYIKYQLIPFI